MSGPSAMRFFSQGGFRSVSMEYAPSEGYVIITQDTIAFME
jgi:hypothetical protein